MTTTTRLVLVLSLLSITACDKKKEGDAAPTDKVEATAPKVADEPARAAPVQPEGDKPAPIKVDVKALFAEFSPEAHGDPLALSEKYAGGATFTVKVKRVQPAGEGKIAMVLDVDGKNTIDPQFVDEAAIAKKPPKAGSSISLTCKIGGEVDTLMGVYDCVVAS